MRRPGKGKVAAASSSSKQESLCNERHRREKMSELYTKLQTMVPNLFPRATRTRIIDETISYTRSLEEAIAALEAQKMAMQQQQQEAITVTVSGRTAFYGWRTASRPALMASVAMVFDRHRAEVLAATVVADGNGLSNVTVTALLSAQDEGAAEGIKADLMAI